MQITVGELRAPSDSGATILNVGQHGGHREIRGAIRYRPHELLTPGHLALPLAQDRPLVLYDEKGDGELTKQIADRLAAQGYDVRVLSGGFAAWEQAGGPLQEPSFEQIVPPTRPSQVQQLDRRL